STKLSALKSPGITMFTITTEQVRPPVALLATHAWLGAALGVVAVTLTRKFSTICALVAVQVTWPTKPGAVVVVAAPPLSPFWNTRPLCQESVMVTGLC